MDFRLVQNSSISAAHNFSHRREIILAFDCFDSEAAVVGAVWPAIAEAYQRGYGECAADVGNVEAFNALRWSGQAEPLGQLRHVLLRVDGQREAVGDALEFFGLARCAPQI